MNSESTMQSIGLYCERVRMLQQCGQAVMNMRLRKIYGCSFEPFHAQEQLYMPYYCNLSHDGLKLALWCREFVSLYKDRTLCISKTRGGRRRWCQQLKCLCFCFLAFLLGFFLLVLCFYVLHTHVQHNMPLVSWESNFFCFQSHCVSGRLSKSPEILSRICCHFGESQCLQCFSQQIT